MDIGEALNKTYHRINFNAILLVLGILFVTTSLMNGELFFQLPQNWFITWMGGIFSQMDEVGFFNVWSGQSHGAHYLYFLVWKPAQAIAGNQAYFSTFFALWWYVLSMGALFLGFWYFFKIVEHIYNTQRALILSLVYILLTLAVQWYTVVDSITITGLLVAIYSLLRGRNLVAGITLGITATIKPMGLILLPVVLKSEFLSWKSRLVMVGSAIAFYAALLLPFLIGNYRIFASSLNWQSHRPPWETIYAFILWITKTPFPGDNPLFMDYSGITPRDWGWTGLTPVHSIMTTTVGGSASWYNLVFLGILAMVVAGFLLKKRVSTQSDLMWGCVCLLSGYFAIFYGWSAQFYFWLVPFLLACFPILVTLSMRIVTLLEYPFFYGLYLARVAPDLVTATAGLTVGQTAALAHIGPAGYWSIIILRSVLLVLFAAVAWRKLSGGFWLKEEPWNRISWLQSKLVRYQQKARQPVP